MSAAHQGATSALLDAETIHLTRQGMLPKPGPQGVQGQLQFREDSLQLQVDFIYFAIWTISVAGRLTKICELVNF